MINTIFFLHNSLIDKPQENFSLVMSCKYDHSYMTWRQHAAEFPMLSLYAHMLDFLSCWGFVIDYHSFLCCANAIFSILKQNFTETFCILTKTLFNMVKSLVELISCCTVLVGTFGPYKVVKTWHTITAPFFVSVLVPPLAPFLWSS